MRKFLVKLALFFALVYGLDVLAGYGFAWLRSHAKGGSTANCEYIANRASEDIIILGSSRATHHYIPSIIEDSLGVSCYNCGEEGNGSILAYGRLKMLTNRYAPKLVIYEITPGYDYGRTDPYSKYLGYLRAYYNEQGIRGIFDDFDDDLSFLKMKSKMYQNTSRLLPDLVDNIFYRDNKQGYSPLYGHMNTDEVVPMLSSRNDRAVDSLKLSYVERIIKLCIDKDINLVFSISPRFGSDSDIEPYLPALSLCDKYGIEVANYLNNPQICSCADYFQDSGHLNHKGAEAYTTLVLRLIKRKIQI